MGVACYDEVPGLEFTINLSAYTAWYAFTFQSRKMATVKAHDKMERIKP